MRNREYAHHPRITNPLTCQPLRSSLRTGHKPAPAQDPIRISATEAKARLSELLRRVEQGESFMITLRGRVVAELAQPERGTEAHPARRQSIEEEREDAYQQLRNPRIHGISGDAVLEAIREGRR